MASTVGNLLLPAPAGRLESYVFFAVFRYQHRYIWYSTGGNHDVRINETGQWNEIPGLSLNFDLPEPASIRVLYSMSVMPEQNFVSDGKICGSRSIFGHRRIDGMMSCRCKLPRNVGVCVVLNGPTSDCDVFWVKRSGVVSHSYRA